VNLLLLKNSLAVALGSALLAALWGLAIALVAATLGRRWRNTLVGLSVVAFVLPPFLTASTWLHYFGLAGLLRPYVPFELFSLSGTVLLISLQLWPVVFFLTLTAITRIDRAYLEFDPLLGEQPLIAHVVWPATRRAFWQGAAISFVLALNNFTVPALLQTKVYAAELWLAFNTRFDFAEALFLSLPLVLAPMLLLLWVRREAPALLFRAESFPSGLFREKFGQFFYPGVVTVSVVVFASALLPVLDLLLSARTWIELAPAIAAGQAATFNTLLFALCASAVAIFAGLLLRARRWPFFLWALYLFPGVLLGIALIWMFNRPIFSAFYSSVAIVLLAYACRFLVLAWTGARTARALVDRTPMDVVQAFGGSRWQQFRLADWPQSKGFLIGTYLLIYLLCLWEVETLIMIVPPGRETLGLRIFNMLHYGHAGQVNALCLWLLALALAPLIFLLAAQRIARAFSCFALIALGAGCGLASPGTQLKSQVFESVEVLGSRGTGAGQFNKPRSLALDRDDNLYVVDLTGRVQKFDPAGHFQLSWQMPQTDKGKPKGMIQDPDGNVLVIEPHYSRVNHFDPRGQLQARWGKHGTNAGELTFPRSAAFNSRGEVFLSEYGLVERVLRFSTRGEKFLNVIGEPGTAPGQFNRPEGIGIGPDDRVYVADSCNHRVQVFSAEGELLGSFGRAGAGAGEMSYPYDVRVDSTGLRFVCEFGNSRVQIFDAENRPIESIGGAGREPTQMFNPWAIALDSRGNLFVADSGNHRVLKFKRREPLHPRFSHQPKTPAVASATR
jgi:ABC-type Fe3+ transport system permease subunit/DNA-binding beta-propeller fold protein YncE